MGLFNSGKNEKVEKVSKYERHYNVPQTSSRRRSSKHRSHQGEANVRAMSQPPLMRMGAGNGGQPAFYPGGGGAVFNPPMVSGGGNVLSGNLLAPNVISQVRYPGFGQFDLSKYQAGNVFQANPFVGTGQLGGMNFSPIWNSPLGLIPNRTAFQQPLSDYQQASAWPAISQSNYAYLPPMQF